MQEMESDKRRGRGDVHELADGPVGVVVPVRHHSSLR
jgi:hypothetical protein